MTESNHASCGACSGCSSCGKQQNAAQACPRPGCCGSHGSCPHREIVITEGERDFLLLLGQSPFLPLARLVRKQAPGDGATLVLQAPVYLDTPDDTPETVRETGTILLSLEAKRLITLDYDKPLQNGDYSMFSESRFYDDYFVQHPAPESTGSPVFEYGSIALTTLGQAALDSL